MDEIFKKGDRAYHYLYKWGTIRSANKSFASIDFDGIGHAMCDVDPLSFTEYTLEGFSQERPDPLPKKGNIVWVRSDSASRWVIGHFVEKDDHRYFISANNKDKQFFGNQLSTTNPYANEQ